jgi:hypothetical protein
MLGTDDSAHSERVYISDISPKNLSQEIRNGPAVREAHDGILIKVPGFSAVLLVTAPLICPEKIYRHMQFMYHH